MIIVIVKQISVMQIKCTSPSYTNSLLANFTVINDVKLTYNNGIITFLLYFVILMPTCLCAITNLQYCVMAYTNVQAIIEYIAGKPKIKRQIHIGTVRIVVVPTVI